MTAFGDPAAREVAMELALLAYLEKPIGVENLRALLSSPTLHARRAQ